MTSPSWSFALATPDAIVTDRLDEVLAILEAQGFRVGATRLITMEWDRMVRMYSHHEDPPPSPFTEEAPRGMLPGVVMRQIYGLAPAAVLVLSHPAGDTSAQLLRCKGATKPEDAAPGTVRALGENQILNLMHCPDDDASAAIELPFVVGAADAEALASAALGGEANPLLGAEHLRLCLPAFVGWEAVSFPLIANRLYCRVGQALALRLLTEGRAIAPLLRARAALVREREALRGIGHSEGRMAFAAAAMPEIHAALCEAAGEGPTRAALMRLAALHDVSDASIVLPLPDFRPDRIYLSPLEAMALDAHRRS